MLQEPSGEHALQVRISRSLLKRCAVCQPIARKLKHCAVCQRRACTYNAEPPRAPVLRLRGCDPVET
ncbi:hypothetical protein B0H10DRAFT_2220506 [Mycena sp. CBHHK59/15]|nr:hypothetical protein B0H10DRAFT_2220506 [Mycena sp. CBHHK59/15]